MRRAFHVAVVCLIAGAGITGAHAQVQHARIDRAITDYEVHDDLTFVATTEEDFTLLTPRGIARHDRRLMTFYPDSQALDVLEAWVTEPDGTRVVVAPENSFTRPSAAQQNAPGFVGSMTTTVLFPRLREGSKTHIKYRLTQKTPSPLGFNVANEANFEVPVTTDETEITLPEALPFKWISRGPFTVIDTRQDGTRHIHAEIKNTRGQDAELNMVATSDFQPLFLGTTLPNHETIGAIYYRQAHDRAAVTPEISALAADIVGKAQGLEAARRVYDWVATRIRYVAVLLSPDDNIVPHWANEVVRNGYGDCKDHVVLMQALLAARGIKAEATLINWGNRMRDLPLQQPGEFNHVIVYLPDYDVYVNPTNPYATFDAFDVRLAGKRVVVATEAGRVARTPPSRPDVNRYRIDSRIRLLPDGTIEGAADLTTAANQDSAIRGWIAAAPTPGALIGQVLMNTPEGGFGTFETSDPHDLDQPFAITATWSSPHAVMFQDQHAYMPIPAGPDLRAPRTARGYLTRDGRRRHALIFASSDDTWTTTLTLPDGTKVGTLPPDQHVHNDAGGYDATYSREPAGLRVTRHLTIAHDVFEAKEFPDLHALLYAEIDDSRAIVVLERDQTMAR